MDTGDNCTTFVTSQNETLVVAQSWCGQDLTLSEGSKFVLFHQE
jgi:hypothetical protein